MTINLRYCIFRYGVFAMLVLMCSGILFLVFTFEISIKIPIQLFYDNHEHYWHGYIVNKEHVELHANDTILAVQTAMGDVPYIIKHIELESEVLHTILIPIKKETFSNTYSEGFIYMGKVKLKDKILNIGSY